MLLFLLVDALYPKFHEISEQCSGISFVFLAHQYEILLYLLVCPKYKQVPQPPNKNSSTKQKMKLKKIYTTVILKVFIAPFILEFMFFFVSVHNLVAVIVVFGYNYLFQEVSFSDDFFKKKIAAFLARFLFLSIIIQYSMCQMNIEMQSISSRGTYNIRGGVRQGASKGGGRKSLLDNAPNYTQLGALSKREKGSIPKPLAEIFFENLTKYKYKARL